MRYSFTYNKKCLLQGNFSLTPNSPLLPFSRSFWNILNYSHQPSHIDDLLSQPDCTLEQLLDDDNILSEFKSLNPKLLELYSNSYFLSLTPLSSHTDDKVKQLLSYLIEEPPEDADRSRGYKYFSL